MTSKEDTKKYKFNLVEMIAVMIVTAICSILITISVTYNKNTNKTDMVTRNDLKELIDTYDTIVNNFYTDVDKNELISSAIESMMEYLDDPYTTYMDEEETEAFLETLKGNYVGMGAQITYNDDKEIIINKVFDNSPAKKMGLQVNDIITKVNGESVKNKTTSEVSNLIKGVEGTTVIVTIKRNNKEKDYKITRATVELESVYSEVISKNDKKVGLVTITSFATNTYEQLKKHYDGLIKEKIDYLIIDLRGNTGGYLDVVENIASLFVDKTQVLYQLQVKGKTTKVYSKTDKYVKVKTALLVNGGTASASEILTACLKENLNSDVVGTTTYGKGKVQTTKSLSNGSTIKYTTQNWLTPKGNLIDKEGIKPTIEIELSENYLKNPSRDTDNQLQKAIEILVK